MKELPVPEHFNKASAGKVWRVRYQELAADAAEWAREHDIQPSERDSPKICLMAVDVQNTFCMPDFELFVAGRSGKGAVDDNIRLCQFMYRNLHRITRIVPTMDTHQAFQIFHSVFFLDEDGNHPEPFTLITSEDIKNDRYRFNARLAGNLGIDPSYMEKYLKHYASELEETGKYDLTVWPYHAMLGGIGHALVSCFEEAMFFHSIARLSRPDIYVKGDNPLTEHYSVFHPEVTTGPGGDELPGRKDELFNIKHESENMETKLKRYDAIIIAGQAKSHCVAWTISDLLEEIRSGDETLAEKVYLLEDCTSPVVIPGVVDYTDRADEAFARFAEAGMNIVRSSDPMAEWPGMKL